MCISATVLAAGALGLAAVGTVMSIDQANYQAGMMELQLAEQRKQLRSQQEARALQAQEAQIARLKEFREQRERNLLAMASSGVGQSMSFLQGIAKASEKALRRDLSNIRLGRLGEQNRIAQQIRVNRTQGLVNQANKSAAITGAVIGFGQQALSIGSFYGNYNTPSSGGGGASTGGGSTGFGGGYGGF